MKRFIPSIIRRRIRILRTIFIRWQIWRKVNKTLCGASKDDTAVLRSAIRCSPVTIWKNLDQWQFPMVPADCTIFSEGTGKFLVRGKSDDLFHVLPMQEPAVEKTIRAILKPGDTFVDAGANIGYYTVVASKLVGDTGRVLAFEMIPETANILRAHVKLNDLQNAMVIECALSDRGGETVEATILEGKSGQSSIAHKRGSTKLRVTTTTLDEHLKEISSVQLVKMDLEGAELGALRGIGAELTKIEAIIFENRGARDVVEYLEGQGFEITRLDGNNALARQVR